MSPAAKPIIIIKKVSGHGGHHGGAWKVAYADFVTAMMALFIVLWLLSSSAKVKKAVAGYFNDPKSSQKESGRDKAGDDDIIPIDKANVQKLKEQIEKAIKEQKSLEKLANQIEMTITPEGLRIELIEGQKGTFFESGSAQLSASGQELLSMLAGQLKPLPNKLFIEGHTDAQPYASTNGYTNWELSADRANSARRLLQQDGVGKDQVTQVRGFADQMLRVKADPLDPSNRRISLIVKWAEGGSAPVINLPGQKDAKAEAGKPAEPPGKAAAPGTTEQNKAAPTQAAPSKTQPAATKPPDTKPDAKTPPNAGNAKPTAPGAPAKPSAGTAEPVPDKKGILDKLKSMLPGSKPRK